MSDIERLNKLLRELPPHDHQRARNRWRDRIDPAFIAWVAITTLTTIAGILLANI